MFGNVVNTCIFLRTLWALTEYEHAALARPSDCPSGNREVLSQSSLCEP